MPAFAAATALLLALLCSSPASAADRDRDRMPDRWERKHHVKKARGDADRDGLRNRDEYRARTNPRRRDTDRDGLRDGDEIRFGWHPRKRDTDRDGIRDGRENAGVVSAVDGQHVTIRLARGGSLRGVVDDPASLSCAPAAPGGGWLPDSAEQGDQSAPEEEFWDPAWGERPEDLDADVDEDEPLARTAQAEEPFDEDGEEQTAGEAEEEAAAEAEDLAAEQADCRASLRIGALVHEAVAEPAAGGRRLTLLRLVAT